MTTRAPESPEVARRSGVRTAARVYVCTHVATTPADVAGSRLFSCVAEVLRGLARTPFPGVARVNPLRHS